MDLRESLNAVSDVIVNRPHALREFDQIYMKAADMLLQAEHVSKWLDDRNVVFVGDGDALALCLVHLGRCGHLPCTPKHVHVLDFDERMVNSVSRFAEQMGYGDTISSSLYNVAEPLPGGFLGTFDAFYTNPPFGGSNDGTSVLAFLQRGIEACGPSAVGCAVLADYAPLPWCSGVLAQAQRALLEAGFWISEMVPRFHRYHLDDDPDLTSCSLISSRTQRPEHLEGESRPLDEAALVNFYGRGAQLKIRYVRDLTNGGKFAAHGYRMEEFPKEQ